MSIGEDSLSVSSADTPIYDHPRKTYTPTLHSSCHSVTCDCSGCSDPKMKMDCRYKTFPSDKNRSSFIRQLQYRSEALRRHIHLLPNGVIQHFDELASLTSIQLDIVSLLLMEISHNWFYHYHYQPLLSLINVSVYNKWPIYRLLIVFNYHKTGQYLTK